LLYIFIIYYLNISSHSVDVRIHLPGNNENSNLDGYFTEILMQYYLSG